MYRDKTISAILCSAGQGSRMKVDTPKQFLVIKGKPIVMWSLEILASVEEIDEILLVIRPEDEANMCEILTSMYIDKKVSLVYGGKTRQESVYRGLKEASSEFVIIHDSARPYVSRPLMLRVIDETVKFNSAIPLVSVKDSLKIHNKNGFKTLDRSKVFQVQTPQGFARDLILEAHQTAKAHGYQGTDDSSLIEYLGMSAHETQGEYNNIKITTPEDLDRVISADKGDKIMDIKIGHGYDVHQLVEGRKLILGGVEIPYTKGLLGHSDADCVIHALMDAMLGALALGDIGKHFPDSSKAFKDIDSMVLLEKVSALIKSKGYSFGNCDITVVCQAPKLRPYIDEMREKIAENLKTETDNVSIKATTNEGLGFVGKGEGISTYASILLFKNA